MRQIKFRAWHKVEEKMYPVWGTLKNMVCLGSPEGVLTCVDIDQVELMEYIERLDHHDREMCEGDIVEYIDNTSRGLVKKIAVITDIRHLPDFSCSKWEEIIGNIYEQPELLERVSYEYQG